MSVQSLYVLSFIHLLLQTALNHAFVVQEVRGAYVGACWRYARWMNGHLILNGWYECAVTIQEMVLLPKRLLLLKSFNPKAVTVQGVGTVGWAENQTSGSRCPLWEPVPCPATFLVKKFFLKSSLDLLSCDLWPPSLPSPEGLRGWCGHWECSLYVCLPSCRCHGCRQWRPKGSMRSGVFQDNQGFILKLLSLTDGKSRGGKAVAVCAPLVI